jgi:hypothetical protein
MGYTTRFVGQFDCFRAENRQIRAFLSAIRDGDKAAIAALADWLSEQGDPRGDRITAMVVKDAVDMSRFWYLFGLKPAHVAYLKKFSETRRMRRDPKQLDQVFDPVREEVGLPLGNEGGYFVAGGGFHGQDHDASILDYNKPPKGQPGLWCQWIPNEVGTAIVWDRAEKFYDYVEWLEYLLEHFLTPWGYVVNGKMTWSGADDADRGTIVVKDNKVTATPE